jgi:hypothetical protein
MSLNLGPLGMLPPLKKSIAVIDLDNIKKIEKLNLDRQKRKLLINDFPKENIDLAFREFKRFLSLSIIFKNPDYSFVPSKTVDIIWHEFILDTINYRFFCDDVYGNYLDHVPGETISQGVMEAAGEPFFYTKTLLKTAYGELSGTIWGPYAACDSGECRGLCWRPGRCLKMA